MQRAPGIPRPGAKGGVNIVKKLSAKQQVLKYLNEERNQTIMAASIITSIVLALSRCSFVGLSEFICFLICCCNIHRVTVVWDKLGPRIESFATYWENSVRQDVKVGTILGLTICACTSWHLRCFLTSLIAAKALLSYSKTSPWAFAASSYHEKKHPLDDPPVKPIGQTLSKEPPSRKRVEFIDTDTQRDSETSPGRSFRRTPAAAKYRAPLTARQDELEESPQYENLVGANKLRIPHYNDENEPSPERINGGSVKWRADPSQLSSTSPTASRNAKTFQRKSPTAKGSQSPKVQSRLAHRQPSPLSPPLDTEVAAVSSGKGSASRFPALTSVGNS